MRILIQTFGSAGDVHPFVAVGAELRRRGHDVRLWANEWFRPVVESAGIAWRPAGTAAEYEAAQADADLWHPRRGPATVLARYLAPRLGETVAALEGEVAPGDTVLVTGVLGFAARIVREVRAAPLATLHLAPSAFVSVARPPLLPGLRLGRRSPRWLRRALLRLAYGMADRAALPGIEAVRAPRGLPPLRHVFDEWVHSPDLVVGLFPDWFGPPQRDWPEHVRLTGFPLYDESDRRPSDPDLDAWIAGGEPPVVFTPGSGNRVVARFLRESVEAAARVGRRALLVTGARDALPRPLPGHARHVEYVPFGRLLPRAAALVSHAGIGTCAQGLAAGVPHLAMPIGFDQFDNASRLADLGVGVTLPASRYRARPAARLLGRLLADGGARERARVAALRLAPRDAIARTADAVESVRLAAPGTVRVSWRTGP